MKKIKGVILLGLLSLGVLSSCGNSYIYDEVHINEFNIDYEYQPSGSSYCSGYASSNALRAMGYDVSWDEVYLNNPYVEESGICKPDNLNKRLKDMGYNAILKNGFDSMKEDITKGKPIISFVRFKIGIDDYHYICVVGYDKEYVYAIDSVGSLEISFESSQYNRKISMSKFEKYAESPYYPNYLYIIID